MLDRRLRQDAVAEVENVGPPLEVLKHAIDSLVEARAARRQGERIEVALQSDRDGQRGDGGPRFDRSVEADCRDARHMRELFELRRRTAREKR